MVVAAPALGALAAFAAMCFLVFLYYAYGYSLGAVLVGLANFFRSIGISLGWFGRISLGFIADGIDAVDKAIRHAIGAGIIATRSAGLYLWHYAAYAIRELGDALADLAETTERALTHALGVTVPRFLTERLAWTYAHVLALEKTVAHLPARVERITVEKVHTVTRTIVHQAAVVGGAITIPRILPLERELSALEKWVKAHTKDLAGGIASGALIAALARIGLGWLRKSCVRNVSDKMCRVNPSWLEQLLLGGLTVVGSLSIVAFAEHMQPLVGDAASVVRRFWRADVPGAVANPHFGTPSGPAIRDPSFGEA